MDKGALTGKKPILFETLPLSNWAQEQAAVEYQRTFSMNSCEFSVYETHAAAQNVALRFNELTFTAMIRGKKQMRIDDKTEVFDYLPGSSVLVAAGETLHIDFPEAHLESAQCITLSMSPDFLQNSLAYLNQMQPKLNDTEWAINEQSYYLFNQKPLVAAGQNIMRIAMEDNVDKDIMADLALKELLVRLMQTQARQMIHDNAQELANNARMATVLLYIRQHLHEKLPMELIAQKAHLSKSRLFKMFKQELGMTPNDYIMTERIQQAKLLLKMPHSVKEVAYQTGFSDANYFIKIFKAMVGITPRAFQLSNVA